MNKFVYNYHSSIKQPEFISVKSKLSGLKS